MNNLLLKPEDKVSNNEYAVRDTHRLTHLREVLKVNINQELSACLLNQGLCQAVVKNIHEKEIIFDIHSLQDGAASLYHLWVGLSRPQTIKKILEHGSTLGVGSFHFFKAELSEKSYMTSKVLTPEESNELCDLGLAQSGCYFQTPKVEVIPYLPNDRFANLDKTQKFILDLETDKTFEDYPIDFSQPIHLAIGPERGWVKKEIEHFHQAGFQSVAISPTILRVEYAMAVSLGQLDMLKMRSPHA